MVTHRLVLIRLVLVGLVGLALGGLFLVCLVVAGGVGLVLALVGSSINYSTNAAVNLCYITSSNLCLWITLNK